MSLFDPAPDSPATLPRPVRPPWERRNPTAWRVMAGEKHLGTVIERHAHHWEAQAGGNALYVPPPANSRVLATMAVIDNARRCGLVAGPVTELQYVPVEPGPGTLAPGV